jgi:hypothetical protein
MAYVVELISVTQIHRKYKLNYGKLWITGVETETGMTFNMLWFPCLFSINACQVIRFLSAALPPSDFPNYEDGSDVLREGASVYSTEEGDSAPASSSCPLRPSSSNYRSLWSPVDPLDHLEPKSRPGTAHHGERQHALDHENGIYESIYETPPVFQYRLFHGRLFWSHCSEYKYLHTVSRTD